MPDENILQHAEKAGFRFLMTDLDLAVTMAHIAVQAPEDSGKRKRNRENARRAYDAVSHLKQKAILDESEVRQLNEKLDQLKCLLEPLGEAF
jgi:hypothetical protein